jgi:hypothetical protein
MRTSNSTFNFADRFHNCSKFFITTVRIRYMYFYHLFFLNILAVILSISCKIEDLGCSFNKHYNYTSENPQNIINM